MTPTLFPPMQFPCPLPLNSPIPLLHSTVHLSMLLMTIPTITIIKFCSCVVVPTLMKSDQVKIWTSENVNKIKSGVHGCTANQLHHKDYRNSPCSHPSCQQLCENVYIKIRNVIKKLTVYSYNKPVTASVRNGMHSSSSPLQPWWAVHWWLGSTQVIVQSNSSLSIQHNPFRFCNDWPTEHYPECRRSSLLSFWLD